MKLISQIDTYTQNKLRLEELTLRNKKLGEDRDLIVSGTQIFDETQAILLEINEKTKKEIDILTAKNDTIKKENIELTDKLMEKKKECNKLSEMRKQLDKDRNDQKKFMEDFIAHSKDLIIEIKMAKDSVKNTDKLFAENHKAMNGSLAYGAVHEATLYANSCKEIKQLSITVAETAKTLNDKIVIIRKYHKGLIEQITDKLGQFRYWENSYRGNYQSTRDYINNKHEHRDINNHYVTPDTPLDNIKTSPYYTNCLHYLKEADEYRRYVNYAEQKLKILNFEI